MIGLTDIQLKIIMTAARAIPVEKRDIFLQRIAAMLALRSRGRFTDTDVADAASECWERQQITIVPDQRPAPIDAPSVSKKLRASLDLNSRTGGPNAGFTVPRNKHSAYIRFLRVCNFGDQPY